MKERPQPQPGFTNESLLPDREVAPQVQPALHFFHSILKDFISAYPQENSLVRQAIDQCQPNSTQQAVLEQLATLALTTDVTELTLSRLPLAYRLKRQDGTHGNVLSLSAFVDSGTSMFDGLTKALEFLLSPKETPEEDLHLLSAYTDDEARETMSLLMSLVGLGWDLDNKRPSVFYLSGSFEGEKTGGKPNGLRFAFVEQGSTLAQTLLHGLFCEDISVDNHGPYSYVRHTEVGEDKSTAYQAVYRPLLTHELAGKRYIVFGTNDHDLTEVQL